MNRRKDMRPGRRNDSTNDDRLDESLLDRLGF